MHISYLQFCTTVDVTFVLQSASAPVVVSSTSAEAKKEVEAPKPEQKIEEKVVVPPQKVEEKPKLKSDEQAEKKAEGKPEDKSPASSLLTWIHENPGMVRFSCSSICFGCL